MHATPRRSVEAIYFNDLRLTCRQICTVIGHCDWRFPPDGALRQR